MGQREALLAVPFHYARAPEPSCTGELPSAIGSCPNLYDTCHRHQANVFVFHVDHASKILFSVCRPGMTKFLRANPCSSKSMVHFIHLGLRVSSQDFTIFVFDIEKEVPLPYN